jgi:hypothetical protein
MVDYFHAPEGGASAATGAAVPANGDTNMDDDVMVSYSTAAVRR